jgi:hypothetical protein
MLRGLALPACLLLILDRFSSWSMLAALPLAEWLTFIVGLWLCYRHRPAALEISPTPDADEPTLALQAS